MPVTVIVAIAVEALFVLLNIAGFIMQAVQKNFSGATGSGVRLAIEIGILTGFFQRKSSSRTSAIALSSVGLVLMFVCGGVVLFASQIPRSKRSSQRMRWRGYGHPGRPGDAVRHANRRAVVRFRTDYLDQ